MGKYNYDKIPALKYLNMDEIKDIYVYPGDEGLIEDVSKSKYIFETQWSKFYNSFKSNIVVASHTFFKNVFKSGVQLTNVLLDFSRLKTTLPQSSITLIAPNNTVSFLSMYADKDKFYQIYYCFSFEGTLLTFYEYSCDKEDYYNLFSWISGAMHDHFKSSNLNQMELNSNNTTKLLYELSMISMSAEYTLLFQKYAKVETKVFPAKTKTKTFHGKYLNETDFDIIHLDSTWFTNLVQSNAFNVRGHFRLQPKKVNGEWTKELIWIDDFQKNGYTRKAQMLRTENEYLVSKESMLQ